MVGGAAQLVDAGTHAVGLHCEMGIRHSGLT